MSATFFKRQEDFRKWLEKNHNKKDEIIVGYYKVNSGKLSITWPESVDQALCFGWIDGVRRSIDADSYLIRFTPRRAGSIWSAVNIKKVEELTEMGLMKPEGLAAFQKRKEEKSAIYTHETDELRLSAEFLKVFRANARAWKYFQSLPPSYKKLSKNWVMSAKQNPTREKRLQELINDCECNTNRWKDNKYKSK